MERILVSMSSRQGAWEAWSRAISLAKRIDAKVYALLVQPPHAPGRGGRREHEEAGVQKRLELLIELAKSEGIPIDYFISDGKFEDEVVQFADLNKITLLVAEFPDGDHRHPAREEVAIHKIRHRVRCRVELVSPRETQP
ncbi:MAG: universal stress protein [Desulforhabdus sp.]|nr:universal stress protein [Desulforhabdus sp.]